MQNKAHIRGCGQLNNIKGNFMKKIILIQLS